jgi:hypoxanthine-guanine phosphoribosyltransferase
MIQFFPKAEQTRVGTAKAQLREEIKDVGVGTILRGRFVFCNKFAKKMDPRLENRFLFYNVLMSETKAVRLTETVKAAG